MTGAMEEVMFMRSVQSIITVARHCLPAAAALSIAACSSQGIVGKYDDVYVPASFSDRFPITVSKGTVKMNIPTRSSHLSPAQRDTITRYAQEARNANVTRVFVRRPGNNINGDVIAGKITQIFTEQGISGQILRHSTYRARPGSPVMLSYVRSFAVTKKCGVWDKDVSRTGQNRPYTDLGCSVQHNLAAQVANPQDFVRPRTMTPSDPMRRARVFTDYRTPKSPTTPADSNSTVSTTDSGKK